MGPLGREAMVPAGTTSFPAVPGSCRQESGKCAVCVAGGTSAGRPPHPPDGLGGILHGVAGLVGDGLVLRKGRGKWVWGQGRRRGRKDGGRQTPGAAQCSRKSMPSRGSVGQWGSPTQSEWGDTGALRMRQDCTHLAGHGGVLVGCWLRAWVGGRGREG
jgi:hypothetical protein